jgi:hypothetical protein
MTAAKAAAAREATGVTPAADLSLFAQLLHGLNQPLTGLQCSLELALSGSHTAEQYLDCVRGGLELIERLRNLAAAMRELVEIEEAGAEAPEIVELRLVLRDTADELQPVAEAKGVRIALDCASLPATAGRRGLTGAIFRALESALSLAAPGSTLSIEASAQPSSASVRIGWSGEKATRSHGEFSRPELGLMLAQAGLRRAGVDWKRAQADVLESIILCFPLHADTLHADTADDRGGADGTEPVTSESTKENPPA